MLFRSLASVIDTMAEVSAWGHLRGCRRFGNVGAAGVEALSAYAAAQAWRNDIIEYARRAQAMVLGQWRDYSNDYDAGRQALLDAL